MSEWKPMDEPRYEMKSMLVYDPATKKTTELKGEEAVEFARALNAINERQDMSEPHIAMGRGAQERLWILDEMTPDEKDEEMVESVRPSPLSEPAPDVQRAIDSIMDGTANHHPVTPRDPTDSIRPNRFVCARCGHDWAKAVMGGCDQVSGGGVCGDAGEGFNGSVGGSVASPWSKEIPKVSGWYWWRQNPEQAKGIVLVSVLSPGYQVRKFSVPGQTDVEHNNSVIVQGLSGLQSAPHLQGEWVGPLDEPA